MFAGTPLSWWIGFHIVVVALLVGEGLLPTRETPNLRTAWIVPAILISLAAIFAIAIGFSMGKTRALEFAAGYTIELSLSIDNLFVFLVLLEGFALNRAQQKKALFWGVAGAIVLRALFIVVGVALLSHFEWISWVFGLFLLYAAWKLGREGSSEAAIPLWIRKIKPRGSLLPVILAVEFTDLLFATDSVPAILSVTRHPFIAYTSNISAVLGLRSLYFALAALLERVRFLHLTLALLLGFVGVKMLASPWYDLPVTISLVVIGLILAGCALANMLLPSVPAREE